MVRVLKPGSTSKVDGYHVNHPASIEKAKKVIKTQNYDLSKASFMTLINNSCAYGDGLCAPH